MNKKIILGVLAIVVIVAAGYLVYSKAGNRNEQNEQNVSPEENRIADLETSCKNTGGVVLSAMCCGSAADFPNLCLIGACGCSPGNSHEVKICDCGPDKCFDGTACK
jgi:hypothetical protein